jgi:hypothetical protein
LAGKAEAQKKDLVPGKGSYHLLVKREDLLMVQAILSSAPRVSASFLP